MPKHAMSRLSLNQNCTPGWSVEQDVEAAVRCGVPGISVHRRKLEPLGVAPVRRLLRDAGLAVPSYLATGRFLYPGERERRIEECKQHIEVAAQLGAECLVMLTGPQDQMTWDEANAQFVSALEVVLPLAAEHRIKIALEPVTAAVPDHSYLHLLGDALDVVRQVDSPWFGLAMDLWYCWWERHLMEQLREAGEKVFIVQVADHNPDSPSMYDRAMLGEGILPLPRLLREVRESGYAGWYDIEVLSTRFTPEDRERLLPQCVAGFEAAWRAGNGPATV